jgi:hypothetical protein
MKQTTKILIGVGVAAGVGGLIYYFTRPKQISDGGGGGGGGETVDQTKDNVIASTLSTASAANLGQSSWKSFVLDKSKSPASDSP